MSTKALWDLIFPPQSLSSLAAGPVLTTSLHPTPSPSDILSPSPTP